MIMSSFSLLTLYFASFPSAWLAFHALWILNAVTYIFITGFALLIDPQTARHTWRQGILFPGVVNLTIVVYTCFPRLFRDLAHDAFAAGHLSHGHLTGGILFIYAWPAASMAVAYLAKAAESRPIRPVHQPACRLHRGIRIAAVRLHVRVLRQGATRSWRGKSWWFRRGLPSYWANRTRGNSPEAGRTANPMRTTAT